VTEGAFVAEIADAILAAGKCDALRELSRQLPAPREIEAIMDGLRDKDDLHAAIIAVSIVEAHLEQLIITRLCYGGCAEH
jgi:hypothetical protein